MSVRIIKSIKIVRDRYGEFLSKYCLDGKFESKVTTKIERNMDVTQVQIECSNGLKNLSKKDRENLSVDLNKNQQSLEDALNSPVDASNSVYLLFGIPLGVTGLVIKMLTENANYLKLIGVQIVNFSINFCIKDFILSKVEQYHEGEMDGALVFGSGIKNDNNGVLIVSLYGYIDPIW